MPAAPRYPSRAPRAPAAEYLALAAGYRARYLATLNREVKGAYRAALALARTAAAARPYPPIPG